MSDQHPMTPAMLRRIERIHDAILAIEPRAVSEAREEDFLDLLSAIAQNEGADAFRAARDAIDTYMDDRLDVESGDPK